MAKTSKPLPDWLPYVLPIALFLAITYAEGQSPANYIWIYFAKIAVVIGALVWAKPTWKDIRWDSKVLPLSIALGIVLFVVWVGVERVVKYPHIGDRSAFDPFVKIGDPGLRTAFIAVRMLGLVLVVPFMEELFWRSFGLRYATQTDFKALPIGKFSLNAGLIVCAVFALAHPEWIPAFVFAAAMAWLVKRTESVFACFVAHAVTNLALGIYVLTQGAWALW